MANKTKLKESSRIRRNLIRNSEDQLKSATSRAQQQILRSILSFLRGAIETEGGVIVNKGETLAQMAQTDIITKFIEDTANPRFKRLFNKAFGSLNSQASKWFGTFDLEAFKDTKKAVGRKMLRFNDAFQTRLFSDTTIQTQLRAAVVRAVGAGVSFSDVRTQLTKDIAGTDEKLGIIEGFYFGNNTAFPKQRINDTFAEYDRQLNNSYAEQLRLNYAVYQGGKIKTTRGFCIERNAKVFNRETILSWQSLQWDGKMENHNIMTDAGGYNCRHYYDWISYELAVQLDPNIERSVFDTQIVA